MLDALHYEFLQHALIAGLLASMLCAVYGTFIVVRRLVFLSGGISHSAFAGLGAAHFFGLAPIAGALLAAVVTSLVLTRLVVHQRQPADAMIGLLWAAGMGLGVIFVYLSPGYTPDLMPYLFGNVMAIERQQLLWMGVFTLVTLLALALGYRALVAVSFDEEFARLRGLKVGLLTGILLTLSSVAIVLLIQSVGIILVMALITIPPLIGLALAERLPAVMLWALLSGLVINFGGLLLSFRLDLPAAPVMVMFGLLVLLLARAVSARRLQRR